MIIFEEELCCSDDLHPELRGRLLRCDMLADEPTNAQSHYRQTPCQPHRTPDHLGPDRQPDHQPHRQPHSKTRREPHSRPHCSPNRQSNCQHDGSSDCRPHRVPHVQPVGPCRQPSIAEVD